MLCGLIVPALMALAFWVILPRPDPENKQEALKRLKEEAEHKIPWKEEFKIKFKLIPSILHYMFPLTTVSSTTSSTYRVPQKLSSTCPHFGTSTYQLDNPYNTSVLT